MDKVRTGNYMQLFQLEQLISGMEVATNNFIRAHYTVGKEIVAQCLDHDRKLATNYTGLPRIMVFNAIDGGTESALEDKLEDIERLMNGVLEKGLVAKAFIYNALLDEYVKQGRMEDGFQLMKLMESNGCIPDIWTYTRVIANLGKQNRLQDVDRLPNMLLMNGLAPNVVTYTALINGYCTGGKVDDALAVMELME
ncbi:hypothetical protein J5N97_004676 [Dioscorea zingiberensis]|uniref:Pentatricopeptide repeat-containing protein n=1 Tax=Dioscorea zingiberensis TaxID=325984 RepID=A0A9D5D937_9LILI|nr:hypothetical protein J5N97_004676 [Dioscorea zingiberensis]